MKTIIKIVHVQVIAGRSKKTGNDYDMRMAQCVVQKVDRVTGVVLPMIGVLSLPEKFKETPKGVYEVEFEVSMGQNSRIGSEVCGIWPYDASVPRSASVKSIVQVLSIVPLAGRSKKTGNDYDMRFAQCIVERPNRVTGVMEELVGEMLLPDRYKQVEPGIYEVEFEVAISQEKRIGSQVYEMSLVPVRHVAPRPVVSAPVVSAPVVAVAASAAAAAPVAPKV